ncbi:LuxR family transcriptional regulator [Skermania sp. ID1734]|uniref:helix-turn-helix transcriptional regulator n=1 Tax=Skermania sp. ID1734 TaxID=2597516 RepID=UPI00163DA242|nr:LuxR family transcriptional regulator [Skermania sp. ID1734]
MTDQLGERVRLMIVRGPRMAGKSTLIDAWLARFGTHRAVVRIPGGPAGATEYWARAACQLGLTGAVADASASSALTAALGALDRDVVLVLEQFSDCDDAAASDQLIDILRHCPRVCAIVETRTAVFTTAQLLATDSYVEIGPEQLCFTVEEIEALHRSAGVVATVDACERLHRTVRGEIAPTLLAIGVAKRLGYPAVDPRGGLAPEYRARLTAMAEEILSDDAVAPWRRVVLRLAPMRTIEHDSALAVHVSAPAVERLGLLQRRFRDNKLEYPAGLRASLLRIAHREMPGYVGEALTDLAWKCVSERRPAEAMQYAADAANWPLVAKIFGQHFAQVIDEDFDGTVRVLGTFPAGRAGEFPLVQAARVLLTGLSEMPLIDVDLPTSDPELVEIGKGPDAMRIAILATVRVIGLRRLGYCREAAETAAQAHTILDAMFEANTPHLDAQRSMLRMQLATAFGLAGQLQDAATQLQFAFRAGSQVVRRSAAGQLAWNWALQGDLGRARDWLHKESEQPYPPGRRGRTVRLPGLCATALCHLENFDFDAAEAVLAQAGEPEFREERWAVHAYVRSLAALLSGRANEGLDWLDRTLQQHSHYYFTESACHRLLTAMRIDLNLAAGHANAAAAVLADTGPSTSPALLLARGRAELLTGAPEAALAAVAQVARGNNVPPRMRIDALLTESAAQLQLSHERAAAECWRTATALAGQSACYVPFAFLSAAQRRSLAELSASTPAAVPADIAVFPDTELPVVRLTRRETELLQLISQKLTVHQMAKKLFVSTNTVKTQKRALYRKLDASTREQALTRAGHLRLLNEPSAESAQASAV